VSDQLHAPATLPPGKSPRYPLYRRLLNPRAGLNDMEKWKFFTLPGLELRSLGRPARSQSLYRLRYPGFKQSSVRKKILMEAAERTTAYDDVKHGLSFNTNDSSKLTSLVVWRNISLCTLKNRSECIEYVKCLVWSNSLMLSLSAAESTEY
jgi:hypothetical protein